MFLYPIYTALKQYLNDSFAENPIPVFFYIGQYKKGKDNTSYRIPAIYIELPKDNKIDFYPKKIMTAKEVRIKIHYISYAPFKNADNAQQEEAIQQHEATLKVIDKLLNLLVIKDAGNKNLTEQFVTDNANLLDFLDSAVVSVLGYKTQVYSRHLIQ